MPYYHRWAKNSEVGLMTPFWGYRLGISLVVTLWKTASFY